MMRHTRRRRATASSDDHRAARRRAMTLPVAMLVLQLMQCQLVLAGAAAGALLAAAAPAATLRLSSDYFRLGVTVGDETLGGHTYVSELFLNQDHFTRSAGFGWTANMAFNYSQGSGVTNRGRLGGTALVTVDSAGISAWHAPLGGAPQISPDLKTLSITGIALGTAATEDWTIVLDGPSLHWGVVRTMGNHSVNATCDRGPTIVINAEYTTTGHVLNRSTQIPSFLDATLQWDPLSGVGFECHISGYAANNSLAGDDSGAAPATPTAAAPGFWTEALTNRTAQTVLLSPSSMELATDASATTNGVESDLFFALSYPTTPGTGGGDTTMALGLTTIKPPPHAPQPLPPIPTAGTQPRRCGIALEDGVVHLGGCPAGKLIDGVSFASFGTPHGNCTSGEFTRDKNCDAKSSLAVVAKACLGKTSCVVSASVGSFGVDPCPNILKHLSAVVHCSGDPPAPAPPPPPPPTAIGTPLAANAVVNISWRLDLGNGRGVAPFSLSTGDDTFDDSMQVFSAVYNMWAGNIFGNSPASIVCLHEMSWFAQIASTFDSPLGPSSVHSALAAELRMFAKHAIQPNGFVYARWNQWAYVNMTIHDQMPHYILCNYWQVVNTGDREFLAEVWPALNHAMEYVLRGDGMGMGMGGPDGLATTPTAGGVPGESHADNWLDIINFGGKDAIINSYLITALSAMAEMANFLGGVHAAEASKWDALHAKAVASFNKEFWNETAGLYSDWIDIRGQRRNYFYVWQQFNAIDAASGIANRSRAVRMLGAIDGYYAAMRQRYNKTLDELWCTPTNLDAERGKDWSGVAPYDTYQQGALQDQRWFGHYENGCCFMVMMGLEMAARGQAGDPDGALALAKRAMKHFEGTRFWGQHYDWCSGDHCTGPAPGFVGADVIDNSVMILYGAVHAAFGFRANLTGVEVYGSPARQLKEGASHSFIHLGKRTTVTVRGGKTVVTQA